jgi:hypothetical protein
MSAMNTLSASLKTLFISLLLAISTATIFSIFSVTPTSALSGSDFDAGNIIHDGVFFDSDTMTTSEIQQFLDSKVPDCDTNGSELYSGSQTRAQYGASRGNPAPYTCVKDYTESVDAVVNGGSDLCTQSISAGTKTAARIIYDVAQACDINPQVLIVLIQKEQGLITDEWPWDTQYEKATGYGCPDTAPCNDLYFGFFNQVYQAAQAFRRYEANPNSYSYKAERNNNVRYHPNAACGSSNVYIENQATTNLYIYTPYQPNAAALSNLYGTGDSCSAYGNRNFWRIFNDWYGSTQGALTISRNLQFSPSQPKAGGRTAVSFKVENRSDISVTLDRLVVAVRDAQGTNLNFPTNYDITLDPGEEYTYYETRIFHEPGDLTFRIAAHRASGWTYTWPESLNANIRRTRTTDVDPANVVISRSLFHSPTNALTEDAKAVSFKVKNNESIPIHVGKFTVAVRDEQNQNHNFQSDTDITIDPGATYTYYERQAFDSPGVYDIAIANHRSGIGWSYTWPQTANSRIVTDRSFTVGLPDIRITRNLFHSPVTTSAGETKKVSFVIKNFENQTVTIPKLVVAARDEQGNNVNFPVIYNLELDGGESYTYFQSRTLDSEGTHRIWITAYLPEGKWSQTWPSSTSNNILRSRSFNVN